MEDGYYIVRNETNSALSKMNLLPTMAAYSELKLIQKIDAINSQDDFILKDEKLPNGDLACAVEILASGSCYTPYMSTLLIILLTMHKKRLDEFISWSDKG